MIMFLEESEIVIHVIISRYDLGSDRMEND